VLLSLPQLVHSAEQRAPLWRQLQQQPKKKRSSRTEAPVESLAFPTEPTSFPRTPTPSLSEILESLLMTLNLPQHLHMIATWALPFLKGMIKQWLAQWPCLSMMVRLDD